MRYLLDTNAIIRVLFYPDLLSDDASQIIEDEANELFTSIASLWEIGIKKSIGKLDVDSDIIEISDACGELNISIIPITPGQIDIIMHLPFHHRDPFDRLIIAQAVDMGVPVITSDSKFYDYDEIVTVW